MSYVAFHRRKIELSRDISQNSPSRTSYNLYARRRLASFPRKQQVRSRDHVSPPRRTSRFVSVSDY